MLRKKENLLFAALVALQLLFLWAFQYFPSQDGPAHIYNADIIREYHHPDGELIRGYFLLNQHIVPTWFGHLILAALMYIAPPLTAEKIFISIYVILLPISVRYALRAIHPDAGFLSILAFPFIFNYLLHMGFYSFSFSLPMAFFLVGYWLKYQEHLKANNIAIMAILSLLVYFTHIVTLVIAYFAIAIMATWALILDLNLHKRAGTLDLHAVLESCQARWLRPLYAFLPTLMFVFFFLFPKKLVFYNMHIDIWNRLKDISYLSFLVSFQRLEIWFSAAYVILIAVVTCYLIAFKIIHRQINRRDILLLVSIAYVLVYLTAPVMAILSPNGGGGDYFIADRLSPFPFFALILWFGAHHYTVLQQKMIQVTAIGIILGLLGIHALKYAEINDQLEEYVSVIHLIKPGTTLLALHSFGGGYAPGGTRLSFKTDPFLHASNYICVQRHLVCFDNYETQPRYFPTLFRPRLDPYIHIGNIENLKSAVDFLGYPKRTGGKVDYVLVWLGRVKHQGHNNIASVYRQLDEGYDLIFTSKKRGLAELYRRKNQSE